MIYHVTRMALKPGVSEEEVAAVMRRMREARSSDPSIRSLVLGRDHGGEYDYSHISVVDDLAAYEAMMNDPAHLEIDRIGLPLVDKFVSFDVTDDPDPELRTQIAAVHQRRFDAVPDVAELVAGLGEYSGSAAPGPHAT
ncbi:Dabb family protein [Promicromonospora sp. NPDC023987]|uniref:Dabb family protein n=1 Tax=Promicromonospora sp. NPDC023987 TaxID=3155360 RepID=UPI0033CEFB63